MTCDGANEELLTLRKTNENRSVRTGQEKKKITPTAQAVKRLTDHLNEYFLTNRATWHQQERLFVGKSDEGRWVLAKRPLSEIIESDCLKFWFWQCQRLPHDSEKGNVGRSTNKKKEAAIVIAEPLVFYSHNLGGYIRLLDTNSDARLDPHQIEQWNDDAREKLRKKLSAIAPVSGAQRLADNIDLEAVRAYIPAGDSNAARRIRRWFRITDSVKHDVDYEEISDVSPSDFTKTNSIVLASRSSNTLLQQFYTEVPKLRVKLTESGITVMGGTITIQLTKKVSIGPA
jgi:hypothetical protein